MSVSAGVTGTYTGLSMGHNGAFTGAVDLSLPEFVRLRPSLELRSTLPYAQGLVVAQRSVLGGTRLEVRLGTFHPYLDFLTGPGKMTFVQPYQTLQSGIIYAQPTTWVLSPGLGVRVELSPRFSIFGDVQVQRWGTPASLSGHLFAKPFTAGVVWRLPLTSGGVRR